MRLGFTLEADTGENGSTRARAGRFRTLHGEVKTPLFMPVGTQATVRNQTLETLESSGSQILLANTYHLLMKPGPEVFKKLGGIHKFMKWGGSVLTDSGGFQVFSLSDKTVVDEDGVTFRPHPDAAPVRLTPEISIQMQHAIGSDIHMAFDQCVPSTCDRATAKLAMDRTHRWAKRSLQAHGSAPTSLFGIVQGACFEDLRRESAQTLSEMPFDGFAIGGLAVGETKAEREDFTELTASLLPRHLPRYLMGVGTPIDLLEAVHRGVDMFDCILPVSLAQQGVAWTTLGRVDLRRSAFRFTDETVDPSCACPTCATHSRAYLHHLIKAREPMGWQLIGAHNLFFYHSLMREIREAILRGQFHAYYQRKRTELVAYDESAPRVPSKPGRKKRPPSFTLGDYEVVPHTSGNYGSIRQISSGETMHSVSEPIEEARRLYVDQSGIEAELAETEAEPLLIWDVGTGAAANLMATVQTAERIAREKTIRELHILTFERDLDSLKLAAKHDLLFPYLRHGAPVALLDKHEWKSKLAPISSELREGCFLEFLRSDEPTTPPDLIFFDPFSFKADSELWSQGVFEQLLARCQDHPTRLFTYSASTAVRARLLAAGWWVGRGVATGPKSETTIAFSPKAAFHPTADLLGWEWKERWKRSGAFCAELDQQIEKHPQFEARSPHVDRKASLSTDSERTSGVVPGK